MSVFRIQGKLIIDKNKILNSTIDIIKLEKDRMIQNVLEEIKKNKEKIPIEEFSTFVEGEKALGLKCDITVISSKLLYKLIKVLRDTVNGRDIDLSEFQEIMEGFIEKEDKTFKVNEGFKEFVRTLNIYELLELKNSLEEYSEDKEFLDVVLKEIKKRGEYLNYLKGGK